MAWAKYSPRRSQLLMQGSMADLIDLLIGIQNCTYPYIDNPSSMYAFNPR